MMLTLVSFKWKDPEESLKLIKEICSTEIFSRKIYLIWYIFDRCFQWSISRDVADASRITLVTTVGPASSPTPVRIGLIENLFEDFDLPCVYPITMVDLTVQFHWCSANEIVEFSFERVEPLYFLIQSSRKENVEWIIKKNHHQNKRIIFTLRMRCWFFRNGWRCFQSIGRGLGILQDRTRLFICYSFMWWLRKRIGQRCWWKIDCSDQFWKVFGIILIVVVDGDWIKVFTVSSGKFFPVER